ncbi:MAG: hypothetical protein U0797_30395 [Gemmataceae bacterium]
MRRYPLAAVVLVVGAVSAASAQDAGVVVGAWTGPWSNDLGEKGQSNLKLSADGDGKLSGTWDGVKVSGKFTGKNGLELRGESANRAYQITGTAAKGHVALKYVATRLDAAGSYKGSVTLTRTFEPGPVTDKPVPPDYKWLDKTQKGFAKYFAGTKEVVLIAVTWDGSMARDVCQRAYVHALNKAHSDKVSLGSLSQKGGLNGKHVYLFGYYDLKSKTGDWVAVFPGIRTSNGAPACERVWSTGDRKRSTEEDEVLWRLTNNQAVVVRYDSTSGGFKYRMVLGDPDIKVRGK